MRTTGLLVAVAMASFGAITVLGQGKGQPADSARTPGVQAGQDSKRAAFVAANCKVQAPPAAAFGRGGRGRGPAQPQTDKAYTVAAIPGVIAAGQRWDIVWRDKGNNADGIIGTKDGGLLLAQNDKSDVVKIDSNGKASVVYTDTYTGGALAANDKGQLFIAERAFHPAIWLLEPQRKLFVNMYNGEYLDCVGPGVLNDLAADTKGGVYMTFNGVRYANPQGVMSGRFGTVGGNGIILSPDGKTLYVTGRIPTPNAQAAPGPQRGLVAFDVQADGSLTNQRQFADTCGDGMTVDSAGRIYCTGGPDGNIGVVSPEGKILGSIPAPRNLISLAFSGPNKKTLYAVAIRDVEVMKIPMLAQGYEGRPK
jgi:gluconolactonase